MSVMEWMIRGDKKVSAQEVILTFINSQIEDIEKNGFRTLGKVEKGSSVAVASCVYSNIKNGDRNLIVRHKNNKVYFTKEDANDMVTYRFGCTNEKDVVKVLKRLEKEIKSTNQKLFYIRKKVDGVNMTLPIE
tara:strand:- start:5210 stop:5608 length:399 start_codon:yes stop_codon:yes gene_type:complete